MVFDSQCEYSTEEVRANQFQISIKEGLAPPRQELFSPTFQLPAAYTTTGIVIVTTGFGAVPRRAITPPSAIHSDGAARQSYSYLDSKRCCAGADSIGRDLE